MFRHLYCTERQLRKVVFASVVAFGISRPLWSGSCTGPVALEARVHSHPDVGAYTALGIWFGDHRKSECAAQAFQAALKLEPNSPRLSYLLGLSLYTAGKLQESVAPLQHAVELTPKEERPHLLLASALSALGHGDEAFGQWQSALRIDPSSKMALDGIAKILLDAGDNETVIAQLRGMQLDENLTIDLATAYGRIGQFSDAAHILNEGMRSSPDSSKMASQLVSVYVKQSRFKEADEVAEQLARRNPQDIEAQRVYLQLLVLNAENQTAMPLARKLLARVPRDADFLYLNGVLERATGDFAAARDHLEDAVNLDPNRYSARYNLGCVLQQLQDYAGAKEQLLKAIALDANEPESHFALAKVLSQLGETNASRQQLLLYQKLLKDQSDRDIAAQKSTQAAEAVRLGDRQKAAALYREAIVVLPNNAGLLYRLAQVLNDLNDIAGERSALEQAVKIDPRFAPAQYQLAYLASSDGDTRGAEQGLRLAIEASPGYVQAWIALSVVLAKQSRFAEALQAIDSALKIAPDNREAEELRKNIIAHQGQN